MAATAAAEALRDNACRRAEAAEATVADLQVQLDSVGLDSHNALEEAQRRSEAAAEVTQELRDELEAARLHSRDLQLRVEGMAVLQARLEASEKDGANAASQAAALEGVLHVSLFNLYYFGTALDPRAHRLSILKRSFTVALSTHPRPPLHQCDHPRWARSRIKHWV